MARRTSLVPPYRTGNLDRQSTCRLVAPGASFVHVASRARQSESLRVIVVIERDDLSVFKRGVEYEPHRPRRIHFRTPPLSRAGRCRRVYLQGVTTLTLCRR